MLAYILEAENSSTLPVLKGLRSAVCPIVTGPATITARAGFCKSGNFLPMQYASAVFLHFQGHTTKKEEWYATKKQTG